MRNQRTWVLGLLLLLLAAARGFDPPLRAAEPAVEKWSDPNLPIASGLELWLDAARLNAARTAAGSPAVAAGQPLDAWPDASGRARHLEQKDAALRPTLVEIDGHAAIRFDGEDDHLRRAGLAKTYKDVTVVVVAAPFSNPGLFRAFLALNREGQNDYVTGLTLDQGAGASPRFETFNPEGNGFGGALNLMTDALPFGTVTRLAVTSTAGKGGTRLFVNGKPNGRRDRTDSVLRMDQLTVGARFYTNGGPPEVRGTLDGDLFEVLVYDRVLSDEELKAVDRYLAAKHGDGRKVPLPERAAGGKRLVPVADPPPVQVQVPGFAVRQLPLDLTNVNNVRYRADGKLVALGYDGNVWLLSDSDGDGLEDRAELFWDNKGRLRAPIGMTLTPPGYKHGNGLFVACKGKCSLIVDTDGDDKADKEIVVADGWQELPVGVDALGVALDPRDGSVYFGLGTGDYTNAYRVDKEGKARYDLKAERGAIVRVAPDFKSRGVFCTGIRFSVGLAFNRAGDLFCTDQEGATWLPNGNPLDELLHLQKGRHYGFPPRHPQHLPDVIDEPSLFDYAPQHQSTCGLQFNEPVHDGPVFGPAAWRGDALVCGYSRGKLYRTRLAQGEAGYVAQTQLLAALGMLTCDACVSPKGDLVVCAHGGGPDWGSGPNGKGKLFKIRYADKDLPQPVLTWAAGPREVRVAFDRPLAPEHLRGVASGAAIEYGRYVAAADRFEQLRPGYQVVQDQLRAPRFGLPVHGVQVTPDRRTLILATAPHPQALSYALTLPGLGRPAKEDAKASGLPQVPETDLRYDLTGVEASWQAEAGGASWTGWLPHPDLAVARTFTAGSAAHDELWARLRQPGTLTLRARLDLWQMLRPAVQPGSRIDYELPAEQITVTFRSRAAVQVRHNGAALPAVEKDGRHAVALTLRPAADAPAPVEVTLPTGGEADLSVSYHTQEDARPRPLPLHRILLPWAPVKPAPAEAAAVEVPELKGGSWLRGKHVFFGEEAGCAHCHTVAGQGGRIGPDLSNLPHRDYASVLRDVVQPNFSINPDYITSTVYLRNGRVLTGTLRTEGDKVHVGDAAGKEMTVSRDEVDEVLTSPLSVMPEGIVEKLGPEKVRDLLTFLLTAPPRMPDYGTGRPPPPRARKEVDAVLAGAPNPPEKTRPLRVVLVTGRKDHGPGEHDYPAWQKAWGQLLGLADDVKVGTATDWPSADDLRGADVLIFYQQGTWTPERARDLDAFLARGGGVVYVHYAIDGGGDAAGFARRIGLAWGGGARFRHGPLELDFGPASGHPVARNLGKVRFLDESYWQLIGDPKRVRLLGTGVEDGEAQPLFWAREEGKGRVFVSVPGHFAWTFDDPLFRVVLLRGIAWAAREPVDRFNDLVVPGARVED